MKQQQKQQAAAIAENSTETTVVTTTTSEWQTYREVPMLPLKTIRNESKHLEKIQKSNTPNLDKLEKNALMNYKTETQHCVLK